MKILASNNALNRMALCVCLLSTLSIARGAAQAVPVPASPESFDMDTSKTASVGGGVQFGEFLGRRVIDLPAGLLNVKGAKLRDGTVEVDVASKPRGLFMGLVFRVESAANMEVVYLRPSASDTIEAVQYTPRLNGDAIWQLLNSSHEKATAHLPANQWVHLKILVRGRTCQVFVNESKVPTLTVTNLRRGDSEGGIGLWA